MNSFAPITEYPGLWLLAAVNFAALAIAIAGSLVLSFQRRQRAWLPIGLALIATSGLSWVSKIRSGIIPAVPYIRVDRINAGDHTIPSITANYNWDLIALGLALGVLIALRKKT